MDNVTCWVWVKPADGDQYRRVQISLSEFEDMHASAARGKPLRDGLPEHLREAWDRAEPMTLTYYPEKFPLGPAGHGGFIQAETGPTAEPYGRISIPHVRPSDVTPYDRSGESPNT